MSDGTVLCSFRPWHTHALHLLLTGPPRGSREKRHEVYLNIQNISLRCLEYFYTNSSKFGDAAVCFEFLSFRQKFLPSHFFLEKLFSISPTKHRFLIKNTIHQSNSCKWIFCAEIIFLCHPLSEVFQNSDFKTRCKLKLCAHICAFSNIQLVF